MEILQALADNLLPHRGLLVQNATYTKGGEEFVPHGVKLFNLLEVRGAAEKVLLESVGADVVEAFIRAEAKA